MARKPTIARIAPSKGRVATCLRYAGGLSHVSQAEIRATCRSCGSTCLSQILDLGTTPLADGLITEQQIATPQPTFPLQLYFCADCSLVQIGETVPPEVVFDKDYPYYSSFIDAVVENARENAATVMSRRQLGRDSLVVELASNDGYLLRNFAEHGIAVLGIDPAPGPAEAARKVGVPTLCEFFGRDLAADCLGRQAGRRHLR
jgi:hypothetical protein